MSKKQRVILLLIFIIEAAGTHAQINTGIYKVIPAYNLKAGKKWIDSVKAVIKNGYEYEYRETEKNPGRAEKRWIYKRQQFVNSCIRLGLYYERMYEKHSVPDMKQALTYYLKITEMSEFLEIEKDIPIVAVRNTVFRKIADIYFKGKGVKQNKAYSLQLALQGIGNNIGMFKFYSKRYFNCNCIAINHETNVNYTSDTVFSITINPFIGRLGLDILEDVDIDEKLAAIAEAYKQRMQREHIQIVLHNYRETHRVLRKFRKTTLSVYNIESYFTDKLGVDIKNIRILDVKEKISETEIKIFYRKIASF